MSRLSGLSAGGRPGVRAALIGLAVTVLAFGLWRLLTQSAAGRATASVCTTSRLAARVGFTGATLGHEGTAVYLTNASLALVDELLLKLFPVGPRVARELSDVRQSVSPFHVSRGHWARA